LIAATNESAHIDAKCFKEYQLLLKTS